MILKRLYQGMEWLITFIFCTVLYFSKKTIRSGYPAQILNKVLVENYKNFYLRSQPGLNKHSLHRFINFSPNLKNKKP